MFYTGFENHTEEELLALAVIEHQPLAMDLAKRITNHRYMPRVAYECECRALRGAGVNPLPNPIGDEL